MVSKRSKIIFAKIALIFVGTALMLAAFALLDYLGNNPSYIDSLNNNSFFPNIGDFAIILFVLFMFALMFIWVILRFALRIKLWKETKANPPSKSSRIIELFFLSACIVILYLLIRIKNGTI